MEDGERVIREFWEFALDAAWDQHARHPELSRGTCLRSRSILHTLLGGSQSALFADACAMADRTGDRGEMELLFPRILPAAAAAFAARKAAQAAEFEPGRCFRYAVTGDHWCYIHIRNSMEPDSFLAHPAYVAENLRHIMAVSEKNDRCGTMYTASWLNSLPAVLRFFPAEWAGNITVPADAGEIGPTMGWQGQFFNRKGELNRKTADRFLSSGVLPFPRAESHCSFAALKEHLKRFD